MSFNDILENKILAKISEFTVVGLYKIYGPVNDKLVLTAYAISEGSDEPVHPHSLVRAIAARTTGACSSILKSPL